MRKIFICLPVVLLIVAVSWSSCKKDDLVTLQGGTCDTCQATCDTAFVISYANDIVPILKAECYVCHDRFNADVEAEGNVLDNYNSLIAFVQDSSLMRSITWTEGYPQMPEDDDKLTDCQIGRIDAWIRQGYPNN